jgi:cyanate permease
MMAPWYGWLAAIALLAWWWQRRRRHRVPGGPIIHRADLERAEHEVRGMRAQDRVPLDDNDDWGPGAPRPPIRL